VQLTKQHSPHPTPTKRLLQTTVFLVRTTQADFHSQNVIRDQGVALSVADQSGYDLRLGLNDEKWLF